MTLIRLANIVNELVQNEVSCSVINIRHGVNFVKPERITTAASQVQIRRGADWTKDIAIVQRQSLYSAIFWRNPLEELSTGVKAFLLGGHKHIVAYFIYVEILSGGFDSGTDIKEGNSEGRISSRTFVFKISFKSFHSCLKDIVEYHRELSHNGQSIKIGACSVVKALVEEYFVWWVTGVKGCKDKYITGTGIEKFHQKGDVKLRDKIFNNWQEKVEHIRRISSLRNSHCPPSTSIADIIASNVSNMQSWRGHHITSNKSFVRIKLTAQSWQRGTCERKVGASFRAGHSQGSDVKEVW